MNTCQRCRRAKKDSELYPARVYMTKTMGERTSYICKACNLEKLRIYRKTHPRPSSAGYVRPSRTREGRLKNKYGLSLVEYSEILESQNNGCGICGRPTADRRDVPLRVDHCHKTGKVRGLLCNKCNMGIGYFNDDITLLKNSIKYLKKS